MERGKEKSLIVLNWAIMAARPFTYLFFLFVFFYFFTNLFLILAQLYLSLSL